MFSAGDRLPVGVEAFPGLEPNDLVLWIESRRALVAGDSLIDRGNGFEFPADWANKGVPPEQILAGLRPLLELPGRARAPDPRSAHRPRRARARARVTLRPPDDQRPAGGHMSGYTVAQLDQIDEVSDGRCPWRPIRQHFGILSFGANAFTAREAGDRLINEHDESEEDAHEELYLVQQGRARFELDGEQVDAPARHVRLRKSRREADGVRRGAGDDAHRARRDAGEGVRAERLGVLGAAQPALRGRQVRRDRRPRRRAHRGPSGVPRPDLQRRVLREPRGAEGRRDRAPRPRDRRVPAVPIDGGRRLRLRSGPRRAAFKELMG